MPVYVAEDPGATSAIRPLIYIPLGPTLRVEVLKPPPTVGQVWPRGDAIPLPTVTPSQ